MREAWLCPHRKTAQGHCRRKSHCDALLAEARQQAIRAAEQKLKQDRLEKARLHDEQLKREAKRLEGELVKQEWKQTVRDSYRHRSLDSHVAGTDRGKLQDIIAVKQAGPDQDAEQSELASKLSTFVEQAGLTPGEHAVYMAVMAGEQPARFAKRVGTPKNTVYHRLSVATRKIRIAAGLEKPKAKAVKPSTRLSREERARRQMERDRARVEQGLCRTCAKPRDPNSKTYCRECLDKMKARRQAAVQSGLCRDCKQPRGEDGTDIYCRICRDKTNMLERMQTPAKKRERALKRGTTPYNFTLPNAQIEQVREYCAATGMKNADLMRAALFEYMNNHPAGTVCQSDKENTSGNRSEGNPAERAAA